MKKNYLKNFNRREFLVNTTGGLAAASAISAFSQRALAQSTGIKRFIVWYVPEGCAQQAFWPANTGDIVINNSINVNGKNPRGTRNSIRTYVDPSIASYCIQPLRSHLDDFSMYSGFNNIGGGSSSDAHKKGVEGALTGGTPGQGSIDRVVAPRLQGSSPISSIYLPVYGHHVKNKGASDTYMSPVRTVGGGTTGSSNWNPMDTYNEVFPGGVPAPGGGGGGGAAVYGDNNHRVEMLRSVEQRLEEVRCLGGDEARNKMEALLASFQALESRAQGLVDSAGAAAGVSTDLRFDIPDGWQNTAGNRFDNSKYWNQQDKFGKLVDIAIDTTVAALALDSTRVSALQFSASGTDGGPAGNEHYKHIGITDLERDDTNDHHMGHDPAAIRRRNQARIFRWYYKKLAELISKLKAIPDGSGTLFDSTLILTASEFGSFNHRFNDVPYIVAGGSNLSFRKGRYFDVYNNNRFRKHSDLLYGVTNKLGLSLDHFGTSTTAYNL